MDKWMIDPVEIVHPPITNPLITTSIPTITSTATITPTSIITPDTISQTDRIFPNIYSFISYGIIVGIISIVFYMLYEKTNTKTRIRMIKGPSYLDKYKKPTKEFLRNTTDKIKSWKEDLVQWFQGFFYKMRVKNKTFTTYRKKRKTRI
jgi:hypothetical protein